MSNVRVLLADDQTLMREGLRTLLESEEGFEVVGECADGECAVACYRKLKPEVVLMDLRMPKMSGLDALKTILKEDPDARILILSTFAEDQALFEALRAGARGYLLKDVTTEELINGLKQITENGAVFDPGLALKMVKSFSAGSSASSQSVDLSKREKEVLVLLSKGFSNKEIADRVYLAEGTVKNHVSEILQKIGVRDRTQAALRARELGIL